MNQSRIEDLIESLDVTVIRRAIETAYNRGFEDGEAAFRDAVSSIRVSARQEKGHESPPARQAPSRDPEGAKRAPRGLTRAVIIKVLRNNGGMSMTAIQERAVAEDEQVSAKTVYNELKRERGKLYREIAGRWSLMEDRPAEPTGFLSSLKQEEIEPYEQF